jgi:alginate O-acetyltransferase complex protein AlgI
MLFNSLAFVIFLPIVFIGFFTLPIKWRKPFLLLASYYFYFSWSYWMGLLLIATTLFDFWIAHRIQAQKENKKGYLYLSLIFNLGLLLGFKYFGGFHFLSELSQSIRFENYNTTLNTIAIPIGISFYTFQSLSYVLDIYKEKIQAEKNLLNYALFVAFFPQLVAGPIERYKHLSSQFTFKLKIKDIDFRTAAHQIIRGFFKKLVIADRVGEYVDVVFAHPENFHPLLLLLAGLGFAVQVNCDFSGYTDIASGVAKLFGIDLMVNFRRPLLATSFKAFWQRHHISFMSWFRDYVYFPLGGSKVKYWLWVRNIFIVFILSGLWHGAKLNLLIWGILLAFIFILESYIIKKNEVSTLKKIVRHCYFLLFHGLLIILVRSQTWNDSVDFYLGIFNSKIFEAFNLSSLFLTINKFSLVLTIFVTLFFFILEIIEEKRMNILGNKKNRRQANLIHFICLLLIFILGRFDTQLFIYFQF